MTLPNGERVNLKATLSTIESTEFALSEARRLVHESAFDKPAHRKHHLYEAQLHANNARALATTISKNLAHEYELEDMRSRGVVPIDD